jgi:hypothetical protein
MTQDQHRTPAQPPADFQEYADARFGFKVMMPKRFEILPETVDPLARMIRGLNDLSEKEAKELQPRLPIGFYDPDVLGELEDGSRQPLRLIEYEALGGREESLGDEEIERLRAEMREYLPETLASAGMPGYEFLGIRETRLGRLAALAFEYRWDGVRPGFFGGDHARIVWAVGPTAMFHVYHHCSGEVWGARRSELDAILASFALMEPGELAEEAARGAAVAAFEAAKAAGDSTEVAFQAGQAAYEAARTAGEAPHAADDVAQEGTDSEADPPA